jgi:hypothetical protein
MRRVMKAAGLAGLVLAGVGCSSSTDTMAVNGSTVVTVSIPDEPTMPPVLVMPVLAGEFDTTEKSPVPKVDEDGAVVFAGLTLGDSRNVEQMLAPGAVVAEGSSWRLELEVTKAAAKQWKELSSECSTKAPACPTGRVALLDAGKVLGVVEVTTRGAIAVLDTRDAAEKLAEAIRR